MSNVTGSILQVTGILRKETLICWQKAKNTMKRSGSAPLPSPQEFLLGKHYHHVYRD